MARTPYQYRGYCYITTVDPQYDSLTVKSEDGRQIAFMQGDEAHDFEEELERAESFDYPRGPYKTVEELFDTLMAQYDIYDNAEN